MLQRSFFLTEPYNRAPYWDNTVLVDLSGSSMFEDDTKFFPGRYRIEVAPGVSYGVATTTGNATVQQVVMNYEEVFTDYFIVRAYCGGNGQSLSIPGTNPYSGPFKVDGMDANSIDPAVHGEDVNHIFGAGGGSYYTKTTVGTPHGPMTTIMRYGGGGNCLGNGHTVSDNGNYQIAGGAGSCLHILPVGGIFGTDYIRAYHATPPNGGSAYGGARVGIQRQPSSITEEWWFTRGGDSPYGVGSTTIGADGTGIGAGRFGMATGAYFNGTEWIDVPGSVNSATNGVLAPNSMIRITYLGPLIPGQY